VATLALLPGFAAGLAHTRPGRASLREIFRPGIRPPLRSRGWLGRAFLLATAAGMVLGGATILALGMTRVFVPQDLAFMGITPEQLRAINPRLVPLIAHDRAGFGGGILSAGLAVGLCVWCGTPSRALWEALLIAGAAGFGCAIGIHLLVGYTTPSHLGPAAAGAAWFIIGMLLWRRDMLGAPEPHPQD
jgi:hypothetical protein